MMILYRSVLFFCEQIKSANIFGSGARTIIFLPVCGCKKTSLAACSAERGRRRRFSISEVYPCLIKSRKAVLSLP